MSLADGSVIARLTDLPVEPQKTDLFFFVTNQLNISKFLTPQIRKTLISH